ncbi:hypothetical protein A1O3_10075 [Capronia epimyces CBS 606.96]|uniref:Transcription factor domain-containing protein n=1 Tax=Capronia epimyces CBS 606.96 TaxID=1182542 RepID=W9X9N6_9EURO|nr:uncharacterized protein A1O3_10075 [Capronia epimyces CBS 606.96]EXJ76918.1 hypothetical protein A1O3_10075 [Capronia epimyces CBS 606.96]
MGLRRSDHRRTDVQALLLPGRDSNLHRQLRLAINNLNLNPNPNPNPPYTARKDRTSTFTSTSTSTSITHAQAVIILAVLEWERGRHHSARLYLDAAFDIMADIQNLHLDLQLNFSDDELIVHRMVLRAGSLIDSHWSLFEHSSAVCASPRTQSDCDGDRDRPRIHSLNLATSHHLLSNPQSLTTEPNLNSHIYNAHLELMAIATDAMQQLQSSPPPSPSQSPLQSPPVHCAELPFPLLTQLDHRLRSWYTGLPDHLSWKHHTQRYVTPAPSLFLLHQQFHAVLILLYRPFASRESLMSSLDQVDGSNINQFSESFRNVLLTHAMRMADLLSEYHRRFEPGAIFPLAVQQGALAASVILASITRIEPGHDLRNPALRHLEFLQRFFTDLSPIQAPAERLARTLRSLLDATTGGSSPAETRQACMQQPQRSLETPNSDDRNVTEKVPVGGGSNNTIWLDYDDQRGGQECNLPEERLSDDWMAIQQQEAPTVTVTAGVETYTRSPNRVTDGSDPTIDVDRRPEASPCASNNASTELLRSHSQSSSRRRSAIGLESTPSSSHTGINRGLGYLGSIDLSPVSEGLLLDQFPLGPEDIGVSGATEVDHFEFWDGDAICVSWSETFKALGAVNRRRGSEKMNVNDFGDVMGCVFKL